MEKRGLLMAIQSFTKVPLRVIFLELTNKSTRLLIVALAISAIKRKIFKYLTEDWYLVKEDDNSA